ncbi:ATP-dependent DNA helicase DinG [Pontibacillus marinus]|uniref:3'-5' exonuclease DinG n=1 Tax=Pontibacillus marinus BH030004 = DSM 16465 TaxID=1385511 RepID=A0A0A5G388_9BACI|nr:ATP-dependent DNA helicase DinG [Pontibacillus marinus]KGX85530.1 DNA polymerase III subunit epsilon [Pontibacillus marinus BH030004 = DSM 16465]
MPKFVVVDLETTGHTPKKGDKIIEVGMVTIENGEIVHQFHSMVNPEQPIPSFISQLTGIEDQDVQDAPLFDEIVDEIVHLCQDAYFVAHHVQFDLGFLNHAIQETTGKSLDIPVLDTVELGRIMIPQAPGYKLAQLAEYLDVAHDNPHRALADAYVTAKILLQFIHKAKQLPYETLQQLSSLERKLKSDLHELLSNWMESKAFTIEERADLEIFRGIALKRNYEEVQRNVPEVEGFQPYLDHLLGNDGSLSKNMDRYEERGSQRIMATTIYDAFQSGSHALIEAETGTGKSLAYLLPAVYEAVTKQNRVVISTHTTHLQSQLLDKEVPLLHKILPFSFTSALFKGKQHYISLKKFEFELYHGTSDNYDITLTKAMLLVWLTETATGDIDEIQLPSSGNIFWRRISAEAEGYIDPKSPWFSRSFYQRARKQAQQADLLITNHSLLCTDISENYSLLASYNKLIIDEAHHLEATAAKHFGRKIDYVSIQYLLNEMGANSAGDWIYGLLSSYPEMALKHDITKWDELVQNAKEESDELFRFLFSYVVKQHNAHISLNDIGRYQYRFQNDQENPQTWSTVQEMTRRVSFYLRDLIQFLHKCKNWISLAETSEEASRWIEDIRMYMERMEEVIHSLDHLLLSEEESIVKWIEIEAYGAKNAVFLHSEPIEIASIMQDQLFERKESVILTSATLTMKDSFTFMMKRLGLEESSTIQQKIQSPFHYEHQVQLMIPNDFPNIKYGNQEDFIHATCEAIYSLATITRGRMLVLFTSYDMLKKTYSAMKEFIDQEEFILIAQGVSSGSRSRLKKNFQAFDQAILFGTSSFWEGVDIPGQDLTSVVIVRLPFQPPDHPVYKAKSEALKSQGKNAFMELSLPNAVIRFKQGFGRLIRSSQDRGVVMVCDDRIMKAKYGKYFIDSIPSIPVHFESTHQLMEEAKRWL